MRLDADATAEGLARTVYLDPLAPPAAPGNIVEKVLLTRNPGGLDGFFDKVRLTWDDVSGEAGYRIYRRDYFSDIEFKTRGGGPQCWFIDVRRPELLGSVSADTTVFRYEHGRGYGDVPWLIGWEYLVTAFNRAGQNTGSSQRIVDPTVQGGIDHGGLPRCR